MTISNVAVGGTISTATYNGLQELVTATISGFYGAQSLSYPITTGSVVLASHWQNIYLDISRALAHQTNQVPILNNIQTGERITASHVNSLIDLALEIQTNREQAHPDQMLLGTTSGIATSQRPTSWGSTITHVVNYIWPSGDDAGYFFNLGGHLRLQPYYVAGTGTSSTDTAWAEMIDWMHDQFEQPQNQFSATNYNFSSPIILSTATDAYSVLTANIFRSGADTVQAQLIFGHLGWNNTLEVGNTATMVYSRGDLVPQGIPAPLPTLLNVVTLGDAGSFVPVPTRKLSIQYLPIDFTWSAAAQNQPALDPALSVFPQANLFPGAIYNYDGSQVTLTYNNTGEYLFRLPYGVPPLATQITITGAGGGAGGSDASTPGYPGYAGNQISGSLVMTVQDSLSLIIGSGGTSGSSDASGQGGGAGGTMSLGANGGPGGVSGNEGSSGSGGGGGAATSVRLNNTLFAAAGGGGGGGGAGLYTGGQPQLGSGGMGPGNIAGGGGQDKTTGGEHGGGGGCCVVATALTEQGIWQNRDLVVLTAWATRRLDNNFWGKRLHRGYHVIGSKLLIPLLRSKTPFSRYISWSFNQATRWLRGKSCDVISKPNSAAWIILMTVVGLCVSEEYAEKTWKKLYEK